MHPSLRALGALYLLAGPGPGAAQDAGPLPAPSLSLVEARALARRDNPELAAVRAAVTAAGGWARQAAALPNPTLSYGREQTSQGGESNWQNIGSLDQPLEIGGRRSARRDAADYHRAAAADRLAGAEARVDFEVTVA